MTHPLRRRFVATALAALAAVAGPVLATPFDAGPAPVLVAGHTPTRWTDGPVRHQLLTDPSVPCPTKPDPTEDIGHASGTNPWQIQLVVAAADPQQRATAVAALTRAAAAAQARISAASRGTRQLRFVTVPRPGGGCVPAILVLPTDPPTGSLGGVRALLKAHNLDEEHRIYLTAAPGIVSAPGDHGLRDAGRADIPATVTDAGPRYGAVWRTGLGPDVVTHELLHTLGAVADDAPHATGAGHCWDGLDLMCYPDGTQAGYNQHLVCESRAVTVLDCGGDDYFNPHPRRHSWLAAHPEHNVALSPYLDRRQAGPVGTYAEIAWETTRTAIPGLDAVPVAEPIGPEGYTLEVIAVHAPGCRATHPGSRTTPWPQLLDCSPTAGDRAVVVRWRAHGPGLDPDTAQTTARVQLRFPPPAPEPGLAELPALVFAPAP